MIWTALIRKPDGTYRHNVFASNNDIKTAWEYANLYLVEGEVAIALIRGNHTPVFSTRSE